MSNQTNNEELDWREIDKEFRKQFPGICQLNRDNTNLDNCFEEVKYFIKKNCVPRKDYINAENTINQLIILGSPERQKLVIEHAAIEGALDQKIARLESEYKVLCVDLALAEAKLSEAERRLEEVKKWTQQTMTNDGSKERNCFVNGYQYGQMEIEAILTPTGETK